MQSTIREVNVEEGERKSKEEAKFKAPMKTEEEKKKMAEELAKEKEKMAGELAKKMAEELAEEKQKIAEEFAQKKEKLRNWEAELLAREKSLTEKGTIGADDGKK